ncbi:MAG: sensor histidine kinase [Candidatus Omnitrophica bacterium]|nr:sensor histidine kinase [Candidatus Omnitrophota bacterium]
MFQKIISYLGKLLEETKKRKWLWQACIFLLVITPIVILSIFSFCWVFQADTFHLFQEKKSTAYLSATILKEKLDKLVVIGEVLATRPRLVENVSAGKWQEGMLVLENAPKLFSFIDHIFLSDAKGNFMADLPQTSEITGKNFSFRDWYKGAINNRKPYVSEIYKRAIVPERNIIAIAIPIKSQGPASLENVLGLLVLQVLPETFFEWVKEVDIGPQSLVYVVDRKGRIIFHPSFPVQGEIVDFSMSGSTKEVLKGKSGVGIFYNPAEKEKRLEAYAPVSDYGWGVVVAQPVKYAFSQRNRKLLIIFIIYLLLIVLSFAFVYLILRISIERYQKEQIVRELNVRLAQRNQELADAKMRIQLDEALTVKKEFLSAVSHELKTPLAVAKEGVSLLLESSIGSINQKQEGILKLTQKNLDRLLKLVNSLLVFQRMDSGRMSYKFEENDLNALIKEVVQEISGLVREKKIDFILDLEEGLARAKFDKEGLFEVLSHLISNAIRFTVKGSVVVKSRKMNDCFQVSVQDTGEGIRQEDMSKLFHQFEQIKKGMDRKTGGTGLGLAISKKIIDEHKGRIWVESEYGKGSTFYFTIPL